MSFSEGNWGEESFDLSENDGFLNLPEGEFFNLFEDSTGKVDELSITNSEDKSSSNKYSSLEEDIKGIILQGTVDKLGGNSVKSNTISRGEAESIESEVGSHLIMPVDTHLEEVMRGNQYCKVPNSLLQSLTTMSPVMSPSEIKQHSRSSAKASSFSETSNIMTPLLEPSSSSPVPFLSAKNHRYNGDNRGTSSSTPTRSTRRRKKNGIDRIIEEHDKRVAEKAAAKKASSTLLGYSGIQKNTPSKKGHRYSGSLDESLGRCQIERSYNRHHFPGSLSPQNEYQVNVDGWQAHEFQDRGRVQQMHQMQQMQRGPPNLNSSQQMDQIQAIPPNLDNFEQFSHGKMYSDPQNYATSNTEQQTPFNRQFQASHHGQFEHQKTPMSTKSFQQLGQQIMNPYIERVHNQNLKREREATVHTNQLAISHNQPLQSPLFINPQEQNHSFQQVGHTLNNSSFSHIKYPSVLDERHLPLFPERNSWTPLANANLHGQARNQWQTPAVQEPQFGTQQHTNVGTPAKVEINNCAAANIIQMSNGISKTSFPSFPPPSFTSEQHSDQLLEPRLDPPLPTSPPANTHLTHRPRK
ncbi:predicted protein [Sclerotinia sclerotiorum 1980 UF-70]|uniref:Uncharacterized protein n=2 Tax=Sclerotinia sclerotiorum (strain ATCC 18683 / 1980 / Ss-1) TaxID=665079 RepID=A7E818_SCLS1|nr:predicted protein [Sclerotinia sclerotiorum 1980 UF-70]APA06110.1 hypothetical protein sscle_01g008800 [Sclerotinia sclerotiorum 1980 UF-70]EDN96520.1 predicted protein [Sclerotinia sclerotiorum 1980 UF-70]